MNELARGDIVEADHPITGDRIQGYFLRSRGGRFCDVLVDGVEMTVSYRGLIFIGIKEEFHGKA